MKTPDAVKTIKSRLRDNPECRLGIMARTRVAFAEKGVNSYQQDKELLVLISSSNGWWYGYAVRVNPDILVHENRGEWIAILVKSTSCIEGETPKQVFKHIEHSWYWFGWYENYYTPEGQSEDSLGQYHSFKDALYAIFRMIGEFNHQPRMRSEPGGGWQLDLRCHNFFAGLGHCDPEMRVMHNQAELPIAEGSRREAITPLSKEAQS